MITNTWAKQRLEKQFLTLKIIWIALMVPLGMYGFILMQLPQQPDQWDALLADPMTVTLVVAALAAVVMSRLVPAQVGLSMRRQELKKSWSEETLREARNGKGVRLYRDEDLPELVALSGEDQLAIRAFNPYMIEKIIQWTLSEAAAMMGFVLAQTFDSSDLYWPFALLALAGVLSAPPSLAELLRKARVV